MRRRIALSAVLMLTLGSIGPVTAQDRWDGGDDLPTDPLTCGSEAGRPPAPVPLTYDGGQPTDPPDKAGQPIQLVDIPMQIGTGYFDGIAQGMQDAADELGNVEVINTGPTVADGDEQNMFLDTYVTQGVDGVFFAAVDPESIGPPLTRALETGIHVVGYDGDSWPAAREWFVSPAEANRVAKDMIDSLVAERDEYASFGIVTSTLAAPNQARWIAEMEAYAEACYPSLTWLETLEAQEDATLSFSQAQSLLDRYGDGIQGILSLTRVATPAVADAVTDADLCGAVSIVGLSTPNPMKPFVESGCVKSVVLWNPVDLGYAATFVMRAVVDGTLAPGTTSVAAGRLGELQVIDGSEVLLGAPVIYTADNIDDFDF